MHTNFTCRLFVLSFEFLCSEVGEVVIVKWVPCRLCGGVGGTARCNSSGSSFALVLACHTNTELNRMGGAWLRWKWSTGKKYIIYEKTWIWTVIEVYSSMRATYWLRAAASPLAPCGCCEESLTGTPTTLLAVASLGVRWWPRSSVVFGEAGGVWAKGTWSENKKTRKITKYLMEDLKSHRKSQMCLNV